jgi:hypothetical protein
MSNDKKQLLNESTVRRFMGLAGIGALSDKFVSDKDLNEQAGKFKSLGTIDDDLPPAPPLGEKPPAQNQPEKIPAGSVNEQEEDLPPLPDDEAPLSPEDELAAEAPVEDIDITPDEAQVLIDLGKKLEGEAAPEGEMPPEGEMTGPPPEEMAMAESLVRTLTNRVSSRIKKEYVVNEVMRRVARRIKNTKK